MRSSGQSPLALLPPTVDSHIMTMLSREPRQIVAFAVDNTVNAARIQEMADDTVQAETYYTDGGQSYLGVDFIGQHKRNIHDKSDTHNIEGSNADVRHYSQATLKASNDMI